MDIIQNKIGFVGPSFTLINRIKRFSFNLVWLLFCRFSPNFLHKWRIWVLNQFGASISYSAYVYPSISIWAPWNIKMADFATLGPNVVCYNIENIILQRCAVVSQSAVLCTGSHNYHSNNFELIAKPIILMANSWVCAEAFVGPGVIIEEGAILGARAVAFKSLEPWRVYVGNPATYIKDRNIVNA